MRLTNILICSFFFPFIGISQELAGKWAWEHKNMSAEVYFGEGTYFVKVYLIDTDIKFSESFSYVKAMDDTLVFSSISFENNPSQLRYYVIKTLTDEKLELLDLSRNEIDVYTNINHKKYNLSETRIDEFYFNGAIGCVSSEIREDYNNCLNFNSVSILSSIVEIEEMLGEPYSIVNQAGIDYRIYLLPSHDESPPYLAVSLNDKNELQSIQLSGIKTGDDFSFSGIRLGDYFGMVEDRLGKPSGIKKLDAQTELWTYNPYPISFEIKDKLVSSIKLSRI